MSWRYGEHRDTKTPPSRLFGGVEQNFLPNVVLPDDIDRRRDRYFPFDAALGSRYGGDWDRALYVSAEFRFVRLKVPRVDAPEAVYVFGGPFTGWTECRRLTDDWWDKLLPKFSQLEAMVAEGNATDGHRELLARVKQLWQAWWTEDVAHVVEFQG